MKNDSKQDNKVVKNFGMSNLAVNNRKTVFLILVLIVVSGISSYLGMPRESFPEIQIPEIYVGTPYPGNAPEVIEEKITAPFEKEINTIKGVDRITSTSIHGYSSIKVEFDFKVTPTEGLRKVKDAIDKVRGEKDFPQDLPAEPNVFEVDVSELPIMNLNLSGKDAEAEKLYTIDDLKEYGEWLEDRIEALEEVNKVDIRGVQEKELIIALRKHEAEAKEISFNDIEQAIANENVTISGGEITVDNERRSLRVEGEFTNVEQVRNLIVKREKFNIVYLHEIADVWFGDTDPTSYARQFLKPVVMLDVKKRSGANLLDAADAINALLAEAFETKALPENLEVTVTNDLSDKTRDQVNNLENSIIFGVLLVVLVLLFFLGLRNALFVGVAIPLSMFMAFMILGALGVTLNVMVLFSLVLALGMLVDNGIVVVENIYRMMEKEGLGPFEAAKQGVGEVALPIIASTATTLAAFVPLALWPGIMGEFMQYLPITLIIVLGSSLFVALVINPVLTAVLMKVEEGVPNRKRIWIISAGMILLGILFLMGGAMTFGNLLIIIAILVIVNLYVLAPAAKRFQERFLPWLERGYHRFLAFAVGVHPGKFLGGTIGLMVISFILIGIFTPKVEFFPINQPNYVNVFIEHPTGTDIQKTNESTKEIEQVLMESFYEKYKGKVWTKVLDGDTIRKPLIKSIIAQVGEGTTDPNQGVGGGSSGATPNKARISVSFAEFQHRFIDGQEYVTSELLKEIDTLLRRKSNFDANISIVVDKNADGPPQQPPINIEVRGLNKEYTDVIAYGEEIKSFINSKNIQGIENLKVSVESKKPELPIEVDRGAARRFNLSTAQVALALRTAIMGKEIGTYKVDDEDYDIRMRFADEQRNDIDDLLNQKITFRDQTNGQIRQIPIRALVKKPERTVSYNGVKRKDLEQLVTVFSKTKEGFNGNEVVAAIKAAMEDFKSETYTDGFSFKFTGQQEDMEKEMAFLGGALAIAVFLIFFIIITQFNSFSSPVVILSAVGLSLIGVFLGLVIFQLDFIIIMTMIGIISLAGVVVNNAIVLIDYTNLIMQRKKNELGLSEEDWLPIKDVLASIVEGGETRLRPVLLTAITTILGLIPLATGFNINFFTFLSDYDAQIFFGGDNVIFFGPMSYTIIFGLTFATFLTLVIVPVMYYLLTRLKYTFYSVDKETGKKKQKGGVTSSPIAAGAPNPVALDPDENNI